MTTASEAPARPKPRRGRTAALVLAAALVGIAGGAAYGYTVQADRDPEPLPALSQADLSYPAKASKAARSAAERHKTDGDLRKLLLPKPSGAQDAVFSTFEGGMLPVDHWMSVRAYSEGFEEPGAMFEFINGLSVRRIASSEWTQGRDRERLTAVRLVQFGKNEYPEAIDFARDRMYYHAESEKQGDVKGSTEGGWALYPVYNEPGFLPVYQAEVIAVRGNIVVDATIFDTKPIKAADIRKLGERQVARL
ncbi:hypothetical protein [Streptomyces sp. KLOTTS4A1]|uniref:hypothetical protein n=1 Tax=Streptomyces sp. KLOTTS4A1 TaxID=3390996 RepID=UPI0039F4637D